MPWICAIAARTSRETAVDADLAVAVEDLPAQRALRLVADEEDRARRVADVLGQVVLDAAGRTHARGGHDDRRALQVVDRLRLLHAADHPQRRETSSSDSPAATISSASASKHSRWRRKTSVTSAAIGLSRNTGTSGIWPALEQPVEVVDQLLGPLDGEDGDDHLAAGADGLADRSVPVATRPSSWFSWSRSP